MTSLKVARTGIGAPEEVTLANPIPVSIEADVQSRQVKVNPNLGTQVVVSASVVTLIAPTNSRRRSLLLTNLTGTQLCYLGADDSAVSATTARALLTAAVGSNVTIYAKDAIYGLSASAAQTVMVWEEEVV